MLDHSAYFDLIKQNKRQIYRNEIDPQRKDHLTFFTKRYLYIKKQFQR